MIGDIHFFDQKTRLAAAFRGRYRITGYIWHITGYNTSKVLSIAVDPSVLVVAPKVMHEFFPRPSATIISPQMCIKHPPESETVLVLYGVKYQGNLASVVLEKESGQ